MTKIAIVGAGIVGAYLYKLLSYYGEEVYIFGQKHTTKCGISPCAWGTTEKLKKLLLEVGLDLENYILQYLDKIMIEHAERRTELMTFDKPRLINDLLQGAEVNDFSTVKITISNFDRIIDATGVARSFLPYIENDIVLTCKQWRVHSDKLLNNQIKPRGVGYAWCFPLSNNEYHIGFGSFTLLSSHLLFYICNRWFQGFSKLCSCSSRVRLTSPYYSTPFVANGSENGIAVPVWGVGESIGCVAPLSGEGIVPGIESAHILIQNWKDPEAYTQAILKKFKWMLNERHKLDKLIQAELMLEKEIVEKRKKQ